MRLNKGKAPNEILADEFGAYVKPRYTRYQQMNTSTTIGAVCPIFNMPPLLSAVWSGLSLFLRPDVTPILPPKPTPTVVRSATAQILVAAKQLTVLVKAIA